MESENHNGNSLSIFGRAPEFNNSKLIVLSVPWSATASFGAGADKGPEVTAIASSQMDFFSKEEEQDAREQGICLLPPPDFLKRLNLEIRKKALPVIALEEDAPGRFPPKLIKEINRSCAQMVEWVYKETKKIHSAGKKFGLLGGDHSTSEGALKYFCELYKGDFGILHIDAHADLRDSYQGFQHSHASVMRNVLRHSPAPAVLVQVGVRDYCKEEYLFIQESKNIHTFFDQDTKSAVFEGKTWKSLVDAFIKPLPEKVYISLDVDGLQPHLFPHTGTPVPGGLSFEQTEYLLNQVVRSRRQIIGFDLVEIACPGPKWDIPDGNTGARLLYRLCSLALKQADK